jgi:hypothetical protein
MKPIPINEWAKDHWSTLAYVEAIAVDNKGVGIPDARRMRTYHKTHPFMGNPLDSTKYPTRLKSREVKGHDDWDCLDDAVAEGLLEDIGTGVNRAYKFTTEGKRIVAALRQHKHEGKCFADFTVEKESTLKVVA